MTDGRTAVEVIGRRYARPAEPLSPQALQAALEYDLAPVFDPRAIGAWRSLIGRVEARYDALARTLQIVPVAGEPYPTAAAMNADIRAGRMLVSTLHSEHPVWTPEQNLKFRVVHDVDAHYTHNLPFSLEGERQAYLAQARS